MKRVRQYDLILTPEDVEKRLASLSIADRRKAERMIRIARATKQWGPAMLEKLQRYFPGVECYRWEQRFIDTKEDAVRRAAAYREPFVSYILRIMAGLEARGILRVPLPDRILYSDQESFIQLGYHPIADAGTWSEESCYKYASSWLLSQMTVGMNAAIGKKIVRPLYTIGRVNRRQNPDATHGLQFTQLEYREVSRGGHSALEQRIQAFLQLTGLDASRLIWRSTHNTYTAPSIEVYYSTDRGMIQILNGGVFLPESSRLMGRCLEEGERELGFAVGLERCYMLRHNLSRMTRVQGTR